MIIQAKGGKTFGKTNGSLLFLKRQDIGSPDNLSEVCKVYNHIITVRYKEVDILVKSFNRIFTTE
jgi:hypothetical protein